MAMTTLLHALYKKQKDGVCVCGGGGGVGGGGVTGSPIPL